MKNVYFNVYTTKYQKKCCNFAIVRKRKDKSENRIYVAQ